MIPREYTDWLAIVRDIPEADLPCNVSTVAYAIRTAVLLHEENQRLVEMIEAFAPADPA